MNRNEGIHRHDISGEAWERIKELLSGQAGKRGRSAKDTRKREGAVLLIDRAYSKIIKRGHSQRSSALLP